MRVLFVICMMHQILVAQNFAFSAAQQVKIETKTVSELAVDDIASKSIQPQKIALVIGNQNYASTLEVPFALNDAALFKQYCTKLLGVNDQQIIHLTNATSIDVKRAIYKINALQKINKDSTEIIVYYSGHGLASENGALQLLPIDVSPIDLIGSVDLFSLCNELNTSKTKQITVIVDACFTGQSRTQNIIASRGITVVPKYDRLPANCAVLTASSLNQKSYPYHEKKHGAFTYFLLKTLKATRGNSTIYALHTKTKNQLSNWSVKNGQIQNAKLMQLNQSKTTKL